MVTEQNRRNRLEICLPPTPSFSRRGQKEALCGGRGHQVGIWEPPQ